MDDAGSLEQRPGFDAVHLTLEQQPLAAWGLVLFLGAVAGQVVAVGLEWLGMILLLLVLAFVPFTFMSRRAPVSLEVSPGGVAVRGWLGRLPLPRQARMPVRGLEVRWHFRLGVGDVRLWGLELLAPGRRVLVPLLRCTEQERAAIEAAIEGMALLSEAWHGGGEGEVPEALRALRAQEPEHGAVRAPHA